MTKTTTKGFTEPQIVHRRKQTSQSISWFLDLKNRGFLNLDPSYQRWSVWNRAFQEHFIDTIILGYPAPAIFFYRDVREDGLTRYDVVDGKQRLMAIFEFLDGQYPVSEKCPVQQLQGLYFESFDKNRKIQFYDYDFSVEYLPTNEIGVVDDIFDRLNRNTARLTRQELRHAKFSGHFITTAEELVDWTWGISDGVSEEEDSQRELFQVETSRKLPPSFPRLTPQARRQMKDVEVVAHLLLLLEEGVKGYSADQLDAAFAGRDKEWQRKVEIISKYREVIQFIAKILSSGIGTELEPSRLHNQADFYSFFASVAVLIHEGKLPLIDDILPRLSLFLEEVEVARTDPDNAESHARLYYDATRSASNDQGPRSIRVRIMRSILLGEPPVVDEG